MRTPSYKLFSMIKNNLNKHLFVVITNAFDALI